jgi:FecR protein
MSIPHVAHCRHLASSLLLLALASILAFASTALASGPASDTTTKAQAATPPVVTAQPAATASTSQLNSQLSYPQIVRISVLQGDVRIARGVKDAPWEKATTDLPLATGFNLVTGNDGRVEIEFEDASTVYLGENSVLSFNDLSTTGAVPHTDMTLLSGTLTVRLQPTTTGEWYVLRTPTDHFAARYPSRPFARINSYIDAMKVTAEGDATFNLDGGLTKENLTGQTATFRSGHLESLAASPEDTKAFADWDNWVNQRVTARDAAQAAMMKEANLASPLPGLADMQGRGRFFSCSPFGTCWEPSHGWSGAAAEGPDTDTAQAVPGRLDNRSAATFLQVAQVSGSALAGTERQILDDDLFPCSPLRVQRMITIDPTTGARQTNDFGGVLVRAPYDWTVCHTGSWIRRRHSYAWVAGTKRHHICPVHWVKYGHVRGFVPIHPRDVAGKPPLNLQHGVFVPTDKRGDTLERVAFNPGTSVKLLGGPPKAFERPYVEPLQRTEEPRLEAHLAKDGISTVKAAGLRPGTPITFDHKSQSFVLARQVTQGGKTTTIAEHFGGEGVRDGDFGRSGDGGSSRSGSSFGRSGVGGSSRSGGSFGRSGGGGSGGSSHASSGGGTSGGGGHASGGGGSSGGGGGGGHK